jgi:hypothetical protein
VIGLEQEGERQDWIEHERAWQGERDQKMKEPGNKEPGKKARGGGRKRVSQKGAFRRKAKKEKGQNKLARRTPRAANYGA